MNRQDYFLEWRPVETRSLQIPSIRSHTAGTVVNNDLIIFGGKGSSQFNEIWKFSSTKLIWEVIETNDIDIPLPRDGHTLTKVSSTQFYVYGGQGHPIGNKIYEKQTENGKAKCLSIRRLYDDLYCFDCTNLSWKLLPRRKICPNGRRGHTMLYVPSDIISKSCFVSRYGPVSSHGPGYLLLFGGSCVDQTSSVEKTNNDMWLYSLDTLEWEQIEYNGLPPPPLYGHCAEIIENYMIVVGGNISSPISQRKGKIFQFYSQ